jgi:DNA-binding LacI/PurR family transcriptional regulator
MSRAFRQYAPCRESRLFFSSGAPVNGPNSLARDPALTALIIYNELAFLPVLDRLTQLGRSIPRDLSVITIGQDDQEATAVPG